MSNEEYTDVIYNWCYPIAAGSHKGDWPWFTATTIKLMLVHAQTYLMHAPISCHHYLNEIKLFSTLASLSKSIHNTKYYVLYTYTLGLRLL